MRILHVNKFGSVRGGSEVYMNRVSVALTRAGHDVAMFAGEPLAPPEGVTAFGVEVPDFHAAHGLGQLKAAAHVLWSSAVRARLGQVLDEWRPDVVHLHLYAHQFSPSIIALLRSRRVPMVMTAHDFKLICPAYLAVRRGRDCTACARRISHLAIRDRCLQGSMAWSGTAVAESAFVRARGLAPGTLLGPSQYMVDALRSSWLSEDRSIQLLRNPAEPTGAEWHGRDAHLLYVGRLSAEKGVDDLIGWAARFGRSLIVAGDGPERSRLEQVASATSADVQFLGQVGEAQLKEVRMGATAQIVPSGWPENAPLAALEAAVDGVPLVVSDRGGLPEIIALGARGTVLRSATESGFREALEHLETSTGDIPALRSALAVGPHIAELVEVYATARSG